MAGTSDQEPHGDASFSGAPHSESATSSGGRETLQLAAITDVVEATQAPPARSELSPPDVDPAATYPQEVVQPPSQPFSSSRPRRSTLSVAIPRSHPSGDQPALRHNIPDSDEISVSERDDTDLDADAIPNEADEWSAADQPTVMIMPHSSPKSRPAFLETERPATWPPTAATRYSPLPADARERRDTKAGRPSTPDVLGGPRLASPTGKLIPPTPPRGVPRATLADPRMERFQELRQTRVSHEHATRAPGDPSPVAEVVRQWWTDLRPGLERALRYQREARASGSHPLPAHEPTAVSRLGDAFGRFSASARELTERAHSAAAPHLKRIHEHAEQAAQAIIDKLEGSPVRQQAPFLGPGRIAVLFVPGVTVGQAQRLLQSADARPLRLIPRKHGFLARVAPGVEAQIAQRLRQHPYVRDVIFIEYDDAGDALDDE